MERIDNINNQRIKWCMKDFGISELELSTETGISIETMRKALNNEINLTFNQLQKVANHFGRGVLFFLEPGDPQDKEVHTTQFRTLANQKPELSISSKRIIERAERQRIIFLSLIEETQDSDWKSFNPPEIPTDPKRASAVAREWLGITTENTFEEYRLAVESAGILVFRTNGYAGKWQIHKNSPVMGFAIYDDVCPVVTVRKQESETSQLFTLMHELGHILMHKTSTIDDFDDLYSYQSIEAQANAFAGNLLVPDHFLSLINDDERPKNISQFDSWLHPYKTRWGVSVEVILRRLMDNNRLPKERYNSYRQWWENRPKPLTTSGSRIYRHREPKHLFGEKFVGVVLNALNSKKITLVKASNALDGLKVSDIHKLEKHYASP